MLVTYGFFGNVHIGTFEKWWSTAKKQIENRKKAPGLTEYIDFIKLDLLACTNYLRANKVLKPIRDLNTDNHEIIDCLKTIIDIDKEPTLKELIDYFPRYLKDKYTGNTCLMV